MPFSILAYLSLYSSILTTYTYISAEYSWNNMPFYHILAIIEILGFYAFYSQLVYKRNNNYVFGAILLIHLSFDFFISNSFLTKKTPDTVSYTHLTLPTIYSV